jgi:hypothetical protein
MSGCAAKAPANGPGALNIAQFVLSAGAINVPYRQLLIASGGVQPYTWSIPVGSLPAGLSVTTDGIISGTPSSDPTQYPSSSCVQSDTPSHFPITCAFQIKVVDSQVPIQAQDTKSQQITINPDLSFTPIQLVPGIVGLNYIQSLSAANGVPPYSYMVATCDSCGTLPDGLVLATDPPDPNGGPNGAMIMGVPTTAGTSTFTIQVTDRAGETATAVFTLVISGKLQGNYVLYFNGFISGQPIYLTGVLTSDGNGNITGGTLDQVGPGSAISTNVPLQPSTYDLPVGSNFGVIHLQSALGGYPMVVSFSTTSDSKIILSDPNNPQNYGSGLLKKQTSTNITISQGSTANYGYSLYGIDAGGDRYAGAGILGINSSLAIIGGAQDTNDNGTPSGEQFVMGGSFGATDPATGRGTASIVVGNNTSNYVFYAVSPTELVAVSTDPNPNTLVDFQQQQSAGATGGIALCKAQSAACQSVVQVNGVSGSGSSAVPEAQVGVASFVPADQNGNGSFSRTDSLPAYYTDQDIGGTLGSVSVPSGTYQLDPTCGLIASPCGRVTLTLPGIANPPVWYLTTTGQGFIVSTDIFADSGTLTPQTSLAFTAQSLIGSYLGGTLTPVSSGILNEVDVALTPPPGGTWHQQYHIAPPIANDQIEYTFDGPYGFDLFNPMGVCDPMAKTNCLGSSLGRFAICAPNTHQYCDTFSFDPANPPLDFVYIVGGGQSGATGAKTGLATMGVGLIQSDGTATLDQNPRIKTFGR